MSKRSNRKSRHVTFDLHEGDEEDTRNPITEQRTAYPRISLRDKFDALISSESTGINNDNDEEMCTTKTLRDVPQQNRNNLIKARVSKMFILFIVIACIIRIIQSHHDGNNDSLDMMIQDTELQLINKQIQQDAELQLIDKQIQQDTKLRLIDKQIQSSPSIKCSGNQYAKTCTDCITTTTLGKEGCNRDCYFVDGQCKTKEIISKVSCDGHLVDNCHECSEEICSGDCYWGDWTKSGAMICLRLFDE